MARNFCVIGARLVNADRTWLDTEDAAVEHAKGLARKQYAQTSKPVTFFVVERKQVVELGMPEVVTRAPTDADDAPAEDD